MLTVTNADDIMTYLVNPLKEAGFIVIESRLNKRYLEYIWDGIEETRDMCDIGYLIKYIGKVFHSEWKPLNTPDASYWDDNYHESMIVMKQTLEKGFQEMERVAEQRKKRAEYLEKRKLGKLVLQMNSKMIGPIAKQIVEFTV